MGTQPRQQVIALEAGDVVAGDHRELGWSPDHNRAGSLWIRSDQGLDRTVIASAGTRELIGLLGPRLSGVRIFDLRHRRQVNLGLRRLHLTPSRWTAPRRVVNFRACKVNAKGQPLHQLREYSHLADECERQRRGPAPTCVHR